jgi:anti-sigma B factor antagonist
MILGMRAVTVHQVPEQVTASEERHFLRDFERRLETERPRVVLDCSRVREMDNATIHLLLSCLEEVMKRNGDVKLVSLRRGAELTLRLAGVDRLFEIFATPADAVHSFQRRTLPVTMPAFGGEGIESEEAA